MNESIRIQMMGDFTVYIDEQRADHMLSKSRKGLSLIQYLIMSRDTPVPNYRLLSAFWGDERATNPENALKTLISRVRVMLNQVSPELGACIVATRGAYVWKCAPGMSVDVYELEDVLGEIAKNRGNDDALLALYPKVMKLYTGDLLRSSEGNEWALARATALHNQYISAVSGYIELLKQRGREQEIIPVCRRALEIEPFDDRLHIELMSVLLHNNCTSEAKAQYDEVLHLHYHYLNVEPSRELRDFYNQIVAASNTIEFNLESICKELCDGNSESSRGAFVCEYPVFKEIFNIQMRNIERLGSTIFLGIVMVSKLDGQPMESMKQANIMQGLIDITKQNLRKGDIITHFAPTMVAMLLPTVNYTTGDNVMERLKLKFYQRYPNSNVLFNYRIAPLSQRMREGWGKT